jgi:hypothetical protein
VRRSPIICSTVAALALTALPATAETEPFVPELIETPTYLVCEGTTKVSNVNFVADNLRAVGWDDSAPTASVQGGGGCGNVDSFLSGTANTGNPFYDFPMSGNFKGNLTAMTVELHTINTTGRAFGTAELLVDLTIDGKIVLTSAEVIGAPLTPSATGASQSVEFSITNLGLLAEADLRNHQVDLTVKSRFIDSSLVNGWVWDTVEVPSGITFNPETLAATSITR